MHDSRNVTAPCDDSTPQDITEEQRVAARRTVAANATDAKDATELMLTLGIYPGQEMETFRVPLAFFQGPA
jgi:hypothetical protein